jgi:hypothetical protein
MNRIATLFLQGAIMLAGAVTLFLLLWEPHLEGRNANATVFEVYFHDPFLAYAYIAAIPVFVAFYQAFQALGDIRQKGAFSPATVKALRTIKYCAMAVVGFVVGGEAWIIITQSGKDDIAGGVAMGLFFILLFAGIAMAAALFERSLRNAVGSGNGLSRLSSP